MYGRRCTHRRREERDGRTYCRDALGYCGEIVQNEKGRWVLARTQRAKANESPEGTCQVCFRTLKVPRNISLHGYKRPGHGYIEGRCWGSEELPYELSCEVTKKYLAHLQKLEKQWQGVLDGLLDPARETLDYRERPRTTYSGKYSTGISTTWFFDEITLKKGDRANYRHSALARANGEEQTFEISLPGYEEHLKARIHKVRRDLHELGENIKFVQDKVDTWKIVGLNTH